MTVGTVVLSATNVASAGDVGGHFWVFMQYARGLQDLGIEVCWLERLARPEDEQRSPRVAAFLELLDGFGMRENAVVYTVSESGEIAFINSTSAVAVRMFRRADLLLNFDYRIAPEILALFERTALVDIDPGLLQFWVAHGQITLPAHDLYFTTGETVGAVDSGFPDIGLPWLHIRPPVSLELWPFTPDAEASRFTTVSSWWGDEWITDGREHYENNKRVGFMEYADLPRRTPQPLELAVYVGPGDAADIAALLDRGWSVRHSSDVAKTPAQYRAYVQASRGEFSCVKPSCIRFRNGWVSDRTICYLASGKPAVVQDTGPNPYLPEGEGLFRFRNIEEAADAIDAINVDYERHCKAARAIAEAFYDATDVAGSILDRV